MGTIDYIAPEQLESREVDGSSGRLLAGLCPVRGTDRAGSLPARRPCRAHVCASDGVAAEVSDLVPWISARFDEIVARALAKRPDDRFRSAGDLGAAALAAADAMTRGASGRPTASAADATAFDAVASVAPPQRRSPADVGATGKTEWSRPTATGAPRTERVCTVCRAQRVSVWTRGQNWQRAREWWTATAAGVELCVIQGDAGIGKTRLARELAQDLWARGTTVLYGRCDEDAPLPYQPFVEALRHLLAHRLPPRGVTAQIGRPSWFD